MSVAGLRWTRAAVRAHGHAMTPTEKLLLRHLGDLVRDDGTWAETKAELRADLAVGDNTLDRAIRGLGKLGLLAAEPRWHGNRQLANTWRLPLDVPQNEAPAHPQNGGASPPRTGVRPPPFPTTTSVPTGLVAPPPAPTDPTPQTPPGATMTDDAQLGLDIDVPDPQPAKPRKDGGPAARVMAAYCAAYIAEHGRQPASERGRVAGQAKAMLAQGHTEAELLEAAEQLGRTRFTYLAEQVRIVRAQTRRVELARSGGVEGWQGADQAAGQDWIYG